MAFVLGDRRRWELPVAVGVVAILTIAFALQSYFFADDLFFPAYFRENPPGPSALTRSWFGHLMPAYAASIIAFLDVFGMSWPAAAVIIGVIHAGAFMALVRIIDATVGVRRIALLAGIAFTLSLGPIALRLWWAASLNNTVALAVALAAMGCLVRFVVHRRWTSFAAGVVLYGLALLSSEKSLLFSVHLFLWCFLVVWRGTPFTSRVRNVLRTWPVWVAVIVVSCIELALLLRGPYLNESGPAPSNGITVQFMVHAIFGGLVPSFFGFDLNGGPLDLLAPAVLVSTVLFGTFVVWSIVRVRSNAGVWLFALVGVLANTFAVSRRVEFIGVGAGRELRYHLEDSALLWMAIAVVLASILVQAVRRRAGAATQSRSAIRAVVPAVTLTVVAAVLVVSTVAWSMSMTRIVVGNVGLSARAWLTSVQQTLPADAPPLIDSPVPEPVALASLWPYNMNSSVLPIFGWEPRFTNSLDGSWIVGTDGVAGPASFVLGEPQSRDRICTDGSSDVLFAEAHADEGQYLAVTYSDATSGKLGVFAGGRWTVVDAPAGSGAVVLYLPHGIQPGELLVSPQNGPACVDDVSVGYVVPAD
ncbi:hypothetical protein DVJ78_07970 [Humibacter sp. BT305]|nr:hypothetical protein DVJ78_07970 [Humibacter sp. BT305]